MNCEMRKYIKSRVKSRRGKVYIIILIKAII